LPRSSVVSDDELGHYCSMSLDSSLTPPVAEYDRCICTGCRPRHPAGTVPHGTSIRRLARHNQFSAEWASCSTTGISDFRRPRPGFPQLRPIFGNDGRSERMTRNPEIEVQPCPTASRGFHSAVRRAGSTVTRYVPFKEGITRFDTEFAVFGHKTASDTKGRLCAWAHKRPVLQGSLRRSVCEDWWLTPQARRWKRCDIHGC
jgi:hypothetical protein